VPRRPAGDPVYFIQHVGEGSQAEPPAEPGSLQEWVNLSFRLEPVQRWLPFKTQQLALLDMDLRAMYGEPPPDIDQMNDEEKGQSALSDARMGFLSELWVLAAYELVRLAEQNLGNLGAITPELRKKWRDLKRRYETIRIPIVKARPARDTKDHEIDVAYPVVPGDRGAGWLVGETLIWRDDLADELLDAIRACPARKK
jgi:hypothetical protein